VSRGLPDHHHQAPGRAQRPPDGGERGARVVEEHRAEPADRQVEAFLRKVVVLCVGVLQGDVVQLRGPGELAGTVDGGRGDIDPERVEWRGSGSDHRLNESTVPLGLRSFHELTNSAAMRAESTSR
jgi:hypothetical protein